jgi:thiol-disulfide isomerase/thioredoxin
MAALAVGLCCATARADDKQDPAHTLALTVGPFAGLQTGSPHGTYGAEAALWYQRRDTRLMGGVDAGLTGHSFYGEAQGAWLAGKRGPMLGLGVGPRWSRETVPRLGLQATAWLVAGPGEPLPVFPYLRLEGDGRQSILSAGLMLKLPVSWQLFGFDEREGSLRSGEMAPALTLDRLDGPGQLSLEQLRGHVVVLAFGATWCPPCVALGPWLDELQAKWDARGLVVVSVECERDRDSAELAALVRRQAPHHVVLHDRRGDACRAFGVQVYPQLVVVDDNGMVHAVLRGNNGATRATVDRQVTHLLSTSPAADAPPPPREVPPPRPAHQRRVQLAVRPFLGLRGRDAVVVYGGDITVGAGLGDRVQVGVLGGLTRHTQSAGLEVNYHGRAPSPLLALDAGLVRRSTPDPRIGIVGTLWWLSRDQEQAPLFPYLRLERYGSGPVLSGGLMTRVRL